MPASQGSDTTPGRSTAPGGHVFDGGALSIDRIAELSRRPVHADLSPECWQRVAQGRAVVDRALAPSRPIYGATTGIGSQKDVSVGTAELAQFSDRMIVSEATNFPGAAFDQRVVRAALIVLINNMSRGRSGMTRPLATALLE